MKNHFRSLLCFVAGGVFLFSGCNKNEIDDNKQPGENPDFSFETLELTQGSFGVKITPVAKE